MKRFSGKLLVHACCLVGACGISFGENLLTNGSFELPGSAESWVPFPSGSTNIPGWTVGSQGGIDLIGGSLWTASEGTNCIDLHAQQGSGSISQSVFLTNGVVYSLGFDMAYHAYLGLPVSLEVTVGNQTQMFERSTTSASPFWQKQNLMFSPTNTGITTITFRDMSGMTLGSPEVSLDNVVLTAVQLDPSGLVAYWSADSNALDTVGGHNGTLLGTVDYAEGINGQAFNFVPTSRINIADSILFKTPSFTLSGWVNPRAWGGLLLFRGDERGGLDTYYLNLSVDGSMGFAITSPINETVTIYAPLELNRWSHFAASFDDETGAMMLYINGQLKTNYITSVRPILDLFSSANVAIGNHGGTIHDFSLNGLVDEVGIYSRALTAQEIKAFYDAADTDKDGLIDYDELNIYHSNPNKLDTDADGLDDGVEVLVHNSNPLKSDSDGDGFNDYAEVYAGKKPNDANDHPAAELAVFTAIELEFITKTNASYYIQSSSDLTTWTNFEGPISGDGNIWKRNYSTRGAAKQYYRVELAP